MSALRDLHELLTRAHSEEVTLEQFRQELDPVLDELTPQEREAVRSVVRKPQQSKAAC
jgi:hypothetical protein